MERGSGAVIGPIRVVAAAVFHEHRVLAARRQPDHARGDLFELPGGKVEAGEDDHGALRRELLEELGCDVSVHDRIGSVIHAYPEHLIHLIAYRCSLIGPQPVALEHAELRWLAADELDEVRWAAADLVLLTAVARALGVS